MKWKFNKIKIKKKQFILNRIKKILKWQYNVIKKNLKKIK